jgi:hypothetical protein
MDANGDNSESIFRADGIKKFENGRMKPSSLYNRIVDVWGNSSRFMVMMRDSNDLLLGRSILNG